MGLPCRHAQAMLEDASCHDTCPCHHRESGTASCREATRGWVRRLPCSSVLCHRLSRLIQNNTASSVQVHSTPSQDMILLLQWAMCMVASARMERRHPGRACLRRQVVSTAGKASRAGGRLRRLAESYPSPATAHSRAAGLLAWRRAPRRLPSQVSRLPWNLSCGVSHRDCIRVGIRVGIQVGIRVGFRASIRISSRFRVGIHQPPTPPCGPFGSPQPPGRPGRSEPCLTDATRIIYPSGDLDRAGPDRGNNLHGHRSPAPRGEGAPPACEHEATT